MIEISTTRTTRRNELVSAAYDLIARHGLEGLRTRDIAARAGVNIATLHYYFATKQALLAAVVDHVTHVFGSLHAPLPASATPFDELRHLLLGQARRRRAASRVDAVMHELMLRSRRDTPVRKAFAALLAGWRAVVEDIVRRCKRARSIRADADPKTVAAILTAFLIGANLELGIAPRTFAIDRTARQLIAWLAC